MEIVELELCANCQKEIPHTNYVMHTAHCARNITLCPICKEPVAKAQLESHKREFHVGNFGETISSTHSAKKANQNRHSLSGIVTNGYSDSTSIESTKKNSTEAVTSRLERVSLDKKVRNVAKPKSDLIPCKFCDLELLKTEITDHENYCGSRTDKCIACGEIVMFKYKKLHEETNHGFLKLNDEPGPRPTWDSASQRTTPSSSTRGTTASNSASSFSDGNYRPMPLRTTSLLDTTLYSFPEEYRPPVRQSKANAESYKQITRRLDCKTEYIKNLLHDSASITVPIRTNPMTPRNHFNHSKGPAPQPPTQTSYTPTSSNASPAPLLSPTSPTPTPAPYNTPILPTSEELPPPPTRRPKLNPPSELCVPCDYCTLVLPHRDLVEHETVCGRSYLSTERAQASARRRRDGGLLEDVEWGGGGAQQQHVYSFDGVEGDRFYNAYRTSAPIGEGGGRLANGRESNAVGGGLGLTSAGLLNSNSSSPFNFAPPPTPSQPITVSSLLTPSSSTDYVPSRPSLVSTIGSSVAPSTVRFTLPALSTNVNSQQPCAGAAAAACASGNISPEVQLPCEFCADMIPASQLLRHQATCF